MNKYQTFVNILDQIRKEAPLNYKRYYPLESDIEKLNQARARAFIHLFLKVKYGILEFSERERLVTDNTGDGGIDAYYIDQINKKVCFIQSKFRATKDNFQEKEISADEILCMDVDRIAEGQHSDEAGNAYNGKIKQLQRELSDIPDIGRYKYDVVILANLTKLSPVKIKKLIGGFGAEIFNFERTYQELVFPVITGTYYSSDELRIFINLSNKTSSSAKISYQVTTALRNCEITVVFVPTLEIAKSMYKYRNSILKYNPRSYLELANNTVNKDIAKTITEISTNEFALYNNGITMLSYGTEINEKIGQRDKAQLIITQPQIINGGQTAFTLSRLYEDSLSDESLITAFTDKEVLLKVITFPSISLADNAAHLKLVEAISKATNQQTPVVDADRRSNDKIQIEMQSAIFNAYGYFYERKRGEYADGIKAGYVDRSQVIDRELFLRLCKCCDLNPSEARYSSAKRLFTEQNFAKTLNDVNRAAEYFFAFQCYQILNSKERQFAREKQNKFGIANYGYALRYGKFAVVSACRLKYVSDTSLGEVDVLVNDVLSRWIDFEARISKLPKNNVYFRTYADEDTGHTKQEINFDGYYKGHTLNANLLSFFDSSKLKKSGKVKK